MRRGENISRRATGVAADIISIVRQLRAAESRADFIHKVGIACKEFRETIYWLNLIEQGWPSLPVSHVRSEAIELSAILMASRRTARAGG